MRTPSLKFTLICAFIFSCHSLLAQGFVCPCGPAPGPAVEKHSYNLPSGGKIKIVCTNSSPTGDFVFSYCPPGGGKAKPVGRCIYVGGQNSEHYTSGYYTHICVDPNSNRARVDVFCVAQCKKYELDVEYNSTQGRWVETSRKCRDSTYYAELSNIDNNNDGISDAGFYDMVEDLYPFPAPELPAEYSSLITLDVEQSNTTIEVQWNVGQQQPIVDVNDQVVLQGLSTENIASLSPNFTATNAGSDLQLTCTNAFSPMTGQQLISLLMGGGQSSIPYVIVDPTATPFYALLFDLENVPLQDLNWSNDPDMRDRPGYISSMGELEVTNGIPTLSQWGLILLCLILLSYGTVKILQRHSVMISSHGYDLAMNGFKPPLFDKAVYFETLLKTIIFIPIVLVAFYLIYGFVTVADVFGTIISIAMISYMIHYIRLHMINHSSE